MALTVEEIRQFRENYIQFYTSKRFYAIFPNGTKIPLTSVPDALENPELRPLKTVGDGDVSARLVLVVEATNVGADGSESIYWRQAFYYSTGTSSDMPKTWFPFDGIVIGNTMSSSISMYPDPPPGTRPDLQVPLWFDKDRFTTSDKERELPPKPGTPPLHILVDWLYPIPGFLPEEVNYPLDRVGSYSHAIASFILGGTLWGLGKIDMRQFAPEGVPPESVPGLAELEYAFSVGRLADPRYDVLAERHDILPYSKIQDINNYIAINKAVSYMAPFWGTGIEDHIPMPILFSVPVYLNEVEYTIPYYHFLKHFKSGVRYLLKAIRKGLEPSDPASLLAKVQQYTRDSLLSEKDDGTEINLVEKLGKFRLVLSPDQAKNAHALGGRRKKRKTIKKKQRKSRKGKSVRRRR